MGDANTYRILGIFLLQSISDYIEVEWLEIIRKRRHDEKTHNHITTLEA